MTNTLSEFLGSIGIRRSLIGVDIGTNAVKVVHFGYNRQGPVLRHASLTELLPTNGNGEDRGVVMALYETLRAGQLKRQKMAIAYNGEALMVRYLTLPKMPKEEVKEAIRWEAKKLVQKSLDDYVLDFFISGEIEERDLKRYEILLVLADRESIRHQMDDLKPFRSQIRVMDVNPLALLNTVRLNYSEDYEENLVFIDIGVHKMDINIAKRGVLRFYRTLQMGGEDITNALMQSMQMEYTEAEQVKREKDLMAETENELDGRIQAAIRTEVDRMILEVQRSIDYYRAQYREAGIRKVILMGGTPLMSGFLDYFGTYFDAEVVLDNPFAGVVCDATKALELRSIAPRFSTSVGLCLRKGER